MLLRRLLPLTALAASHASANFLFFRRQTDCQTAYNTCISSGKSQVACGCALATCSGEDSAQIKSYCSNATGTGGLAAAATAAATGAVTVTATGTVFSTATASATGSIITGTAGSQPSGIAPVTAAAGSIGLGDTCSDDRQCMSGAQCYASNSMLIRKCGNFNAVCTDGTQCAFNSCNNGLCNGLLAGASNGTSAVATGVVYNGSYATATSPAMYTGGAGRRQVEAAVAIVAGLLPFAF